VYILRFFKIKSNSLTSTLYFTNINLKYVTFLNHSPFGLFHKNLIFPVGCSALIKLHYFNAVFPTHQILSPSPLLALSPSNIIDNLGWCSSLTGPTLKINGWKKPKSPLQNPSRLLQPQRCCELICSRPS
jgi:hypothetical protein